MDLLSALETNDEDDFGSEDKIADFFTGMVLESKRNEFSVDLNSVVGFGIFDSLLMLAVFVEARVLVDFDTDLEDVIMMFSQCEPNVESNEMHKHYQSLDKDRGCIVGKAVFHKALSRVESSSKMLVNQCKYSKNYGSSGGTSNHIIQK